MPQPTLSDVHVNAPLSNLSLMYAQEMDNFVADKVFPIIPVQNKSDLYYIFDRSDFNRDQMQKRAPATESAGGGYKLGTGSYDATVWALHKDIDDQIRANSDPGLNPDMNATRWLTTQSMISKEVAWAAAFFTSGVWTGSQITGVAAGPVLGTSVLQWNDINSTPIADVRAMATAVALANGGFRPNKLVLGRPVFDALLDHPDFLVRLNAGQTPGGPARVTREVLAMLFEVDEVLVMDAIYNTGPDSNLAVNSGESNAFIGGKSALFVYTPSAPALDTPGAGYNFSWTGYYGANGFGSRISSFRMEAAALDSRGDRAGVCV